MWLTSQYLPYMYQIRILSRTLHRIKWGSRPHLKLSTKTESEICPEDHQVWPPPKQFNFNAFKFKFQLIYDLKYRNLCINNTIEHCPSFKMDKLWVCFVLFLLWFSLLVCLDFGWESIGPHPVVLRGYSIWNQGSLLVVLVAEWY